MKIRSKLSRKYQFGLFVALFRFAFLFDYFRYLRVELSCAYVKLMRAVLALSFSLRCFFFKLGNQNISLSAIILVNPGDRIIELMTWVDHYIVPDICVFCSNTVFYFTGILLYLFDLWCNFLCPTSRSTEEFFWLFLTRIYRFFIFSWAVVPVFGHLENR